MKHWHFIILLIGVFILLSFNYSTGSDDEIEELISKMTLEEKVGQMTNIGLTAVCQGPFWNDTDSLELDMIKLEELILKYHVGSIQNKGKYPPSVDEWHRLISQIQDFTIRRSRLGIPILFGNDGVHGANYSASSTLFPHQIACAATWDPKHAEIMGEITAYELRASSIPWNYAPVLDISYQPLWGRIFESFGEDTYLTTQFGKSFIHGSQGDDVSNEKKVAVCIKHFIGYGSPYNGKDRATAYITSNDLKQYYLPPFIAAINSGVMTIMLNSGSVNGIPGHINKHLITNVLKGELGFKGFVISDWDDLTKLVDAHNVALNNKEAAKLSVLAGMDMCMVPYDASFASDLVELVNEGEVPIERINDAVRRILRVKTALGLFEHPSTDPQTYPLYGSEKFSLASYEAAKECITLLKNEENTLPINSNTRILVTGPTANSINYLNAAWSRTWSGLEEEYNDPGKATVLEAIIENAGENNVSYTLGSSFYEDINSDTAILLARDVDLIVACLGEEPATEKPSDINELDLPDAQLLLVKKLAQTGKPIVLVLLQGRPRIIREIEEISEAVVMAYWPGQEGGRAIADVLFGIVNPSGRLPYTYPRHSGSIWKYNYKEADVMDREFKLNGFNPQYEFGEGLSYTSFTYSEPVLSCDTIHTGESLEVSIEVTNTGEVYGKEVVQLYTRDVVASISPDIKKLVRFKKIGLAPGETTNVSFTFNTNDLAFVGINNQWVTEAGEFNILIGGTPKDLQMKSFYMK